MKVLHRVHAGSGVDRARSGGIDLGGYRTGTVVVLTMVLVCWTACATSSMAKIETTSSQAESGFSTDILTVDGKERPTLAIEPGRHVVEVVGTSRRVGANASTGTKGAAAGAAAVNPLFAAGVALAAWADATHSAPMKACFIARPGRTYEVRTFIEGQVWNVQVVDETTTYDVKSPCKKPAGRPDTR